MSAIPSPWRFTLASLAAVWLLVLWVFRDTAQGMSDIWTRSDTYAHGWVIPPLVLWLMWRQRASVWQQAPQPSAWGLCPLLAFAALWLLGQLAEVSAARQFGLVGMLVCLVPVTVGWQTTRVWAFPLGFAFLAVPFGDFLLPWLMQRTAEFTVLAVRASGVPVYQEGLQFVIPSGHWSVVEACSGIRYLVASFMAGLLYGHLNFRSTRLRVAFLLLAVAVALMANWVRAYLIVMLGHFSGNQLATGVDHLIYGWVFFGVVLALLFGLAARWQDSAPTEDMPCPVPAHDAVLASGRAPWSVVMFAAVVVFATQALWMQLASSISRQPVQLAEVAVPLRGWLPAQLPWSWAPAYQGVRASSQTGWQREGADVVGLHVAYYRNQGVSSRLVSSTNQLTASRDTHWAVLDEGTAQTSLGGRALPVWQAELKDMSAGLTQNPARLRVWRLYWVAGRLEANPVKAKLLGAWALARGQGDDGAIVTLYTRQSAQAPALLSGFLSDQEASLLKGLATTRGRD